MPAIALPEEARVIELRPRPPDGADRLAYIGGKVVGRARRAAVAGGAHGGSRAGVIPTMTGFGKYTRF
jgi:hypothetical protein